MKFTFYLQLDFLFIFLIRNIAFDLLTLRSKNTLQAIIKSDGIWRTLLTLPLLPAPNLEINLISDFLNLIFDSFDTASSFNALLRFFCGSNSESSEKLCKDFGAPGRFSRKDLWIVCSIILKYYLN